METGQSRSTSHAWSLMAAVMCMGMLGGVGQVEAAKMPKVEICHYDADTGEYRLLRVSLNAQAAHLAHGDGLPGESNAAAITFDVDCTIVHDKPKVLAHAFIDFGPNDRIYDPATDFSIALLEDTNRDGVVSPGDEVTMGAYPLNFTPQDAGDLASWLVPSHTVHEVLQDDPTLIRVITTTTLTHELQWSSQVTEHEFFEDRIDDNAESRMEDGTSIHFESDSIQIRVDSPSQPETAISIPRTAPGDDPFLQVTFE